MSKIIRNFEVNKLGTFLSLGDLLRESDGRGYFRAAEILCHSVAED